MSDSPSQRDLFLAILAMDSYNRGYDVGIGGLSDEVQLTTQSRLADQFFNAVRSSLDPGQTITLTGHSLGGGLAGYIGDVTATNSVLFDNMPYGVAATLRLTELGHTGAPMTQARTYFTENEFLQAARSGDAQIIAGLVFGAFGAEALGEYGVNLGEQTAAYEESIVKTSLDSHAGLSIASAAPFSFYHSMSLLTSLLWAKAENKIGWIGAAPQLWQSYFDEDVAKVIAEATARTVVQNGGTESGTLRAAIAYSAVESSAVDAAKPFGDTAIWSMFNDAGDLGAVLAGSEAGFAAGVELMSFAPKNNDLQRNSIIERHAP